MANIINNYSSTIVTIFHDVVKNYEHNLDVIKQCEESLNDINHEIELSDDFSDCGICKYWNGRSFHCDEFCHIKPNPV